MEEFQPDNVNIITQYKAIHQVQFHKILPFQNCQISSSSSILVKKLSRFECCNNTSKILTSFQSIYLASKLGGDLNLIFREENSVSLSYIHVSHLTSSRLQRLQIKLTGRRSVWQEKNGQKFIKVAQEWFHYKN